eukprot:TRINITY_DN87170_c0_g1_i1.p1 TRINITY_DN87170_c0_g1~~TRINITY_DN87170_c0_g1_i1.p1  ORF type:complete len:585 (+),score=116.96 TRINITY_DN87170_c0_g1_i1:37-1791(+)
MAAQQSSRQPNPPSGQAALPGSTAFPESLDQVYNWFSDSVGNLGLENIFAGGASSSNRPTQQVSGSPAGGSPSTQSSGVSPQAASTEEPLTLGRLSTSLSGFFTSLGGPTGGGDCATLSQRGNRRYNSKEGNGRANRANMDQKECPDFDWRMPCAEERMTANTGLASSSAQVPEGAGIASQQPIGQSPSSPSRAYRSTAAKAEEPYDVSMNHNLDQPHGSGFERPLDRFQGRLPDDGKGGKQDPTEQARASGTSASSNIMKRSAADYEVDQEDLLDQHVGYYLRHHADVAKMRTISRKRPGVYDLDGREIRVEWQYAADPGGQGWLVVLDGPLRQPFADYMVHSDKNAEYDIQGIGAGSALHSIPKEKRLSFRDQHKMYSRLEAMKVAKEQALTREKAADYIKDGREVPRELLSKYKKTIAQKLDPGGRRRSGAEREKTERDRQRSLEPGQAGAASERGSAPATGMDENNQRQAAYNPNPSSAARAEQPTTPRTSTGGAGAAGCTTQQSAQAWTGPGSFPQQAWPAADLGYRSAGAGHLQPPVGLFQPAPLGTLQIGLMPNAGHQAPGATAAPYAGAVWAQQRL